ncbi:MAG TPA: sulfurtransferase [Nakamurella sp.]
MTDSPLPPLITADELAAQLAGGSPPIVLDVRWTLAGTDEPGYLAGHLPGARFLDLDRDLAGPPGLGGRHPLPDPAALQVALRRLGLSDGSSVIVYDGGPGLSAARAWWLLRWSGLANVRVLDGGLPAWLADTGRAIATGPAAAPAAGTVTVRSGALPVVDADGAVAAAVAGRLVDVRAAARFRGEVEPIDPVAGHIPGAVNLPITELMRPDGTYRPTEEIKAALLRVGVDHDRTVVASCGSGVTACQLVLAAALVGIEATLFPGSYSQWCALRRPVASGG